MKGSSFRHGLDQLMNEIDAHLRQKVCEMHLSSDAYEKMASQNGFKVASDFLIK